MDTKQIDVTCPCCKSRLAVDVRTSKILRWSPEREVDELGKTRPTESGWERALGKAQTRPGEGADPFDAALRKEKEREADLDRRFRDASEKAADGDED